MNSGSAEEVTEIRKRPMLREECRIWCARWNVSVAPAGTSSGSSGTKTA